MKKKITLALFLSLLTGLLIFAVGLSSCSNRDATDSSQDIIIINESDTEKIDNMDESLGDTNIQNALNIWDVNIYNDSFSKTTALIAKESGVIDITLMIQRKNQLMVPVSGNNLIAYIYSNPVHFTENEASWDGYDDNGKWTGGVQRTGVLNWELEDLIYSLSLTSRKDKSFDELKEEGIIITQYIIENKNKLPMDYNINNSDYITDGFDNEYWQVKHKLNEGNSFLSFSIERHVTNEVINENIRSGEYYYEESSDEEAQFRQLYFMQTECLFHVWSREEGISDTNLTSLFEEWTSEENLNQLIYLTKIYD